MNRRVGEAQSSGSPSRAGDAPAPGHGDGSAGASESGAGTRNRLSRRPRFEALARWAPIAAAAACGALSAFGLAPVGAWPITLLGLAALGALAVRAETRGRMAWLFWSFGVGYFLHAMSWLVEPFLVDAEANGWMAPFALGAMAAGLSLFWAVAGWVGHSSRVSGIWAAAFALGATEILRGHLFTGLPWAGLAQIWIDTAVARSLAWIGPYGLGALTVLATIPLGAVAANFAWRRFATVWRGNDSFGPNGTGVTRLDALLAFLPAVALALLWTLPEPEISYGDKIARVVQPNAEQRLKWDPAWVNVFFHRQMRLSSEDRDPDAPPDLVVWPELAVIWPLDEAGPALEAATEAAGAPLVTGILRREAGTHYNSVVVAGHGGAVGATYDKHHLVPFGEYIPAALMFSRVDTLGATGLAARAAAGFGAGPGPSLLNLPGIGAALPLVCYEAIFPGGLKGTERPSVLLALTNDAWFGTRSGPQQHLAQARMRAIEQGLPMFRAANTGISAVIDPAGRVVSSLPLGEAGFLDSRIPHPLPATPYSRINELPLWIVLLAGFALAWLAPQAIARARRED